LPVRALQDVNGCNEITYTEFIAATLDLHGRVEEKRLAEAFDLMDDDDSGYISKEVCGVVTNELFVTPVDANGRFSYIFSKDLIKLLGKSVSPYRIDALIQQADFDGDGRISFADFLEMFRVDNCKCANEALGLQSSLQSCMEGSSTSEAE
jgi:Ca2+-binding EF-hand superfamily protein